MRGPHGAKVFLMDPVRPGNLRRKTGSGSDIFRACFTKMHHATLWGVLHLRQGFYGPAVPGHHEVTFFQCRKIKISPGKEDPDR